MLERETIKVLVCGGRDFINVPLLWCKLDEIHADRQFRWLIEGASDEVTGPYVGADYWAHQWALARGITTIRCPADWETHGKAAGPIRNAFMLSEHQPDLVVTFSGARGTADMKKRARAAGIEVLEVG